MFELTVLEDAVRIPAKTLNVVPFKETVQRELVKKYANKVSTPHLVYLLVMFHVCPGY